MEGNLVMVIEKVDEVLEVTAIWSLPGMLPGETFQMCTVASWQPATNHMEPSGSLATSAVSSAPCAMQFMGRSTQH